MAALGGAIFCNPSSILADQTATIAVGSSVTFSVTANGSNPFTYQWRKNGINVSGATTNSYNIVNIQPIDAGLYTVAVTNSLGSTTSDVANVTVAMPPPIPPTITTQPQDQTVTAGAGATFAVVATGSPSPSYQWRKSGVDVSGATASSYVISAAQQADAGSYTVLVSNSAGSVASSAASLTVNPAPTSPAISTQPVSQTVTAGGTATFTVSAYGTAPLTYKWKKNGSSISGATSATYTITNVAQTLSGSNYTVVVTNAQGSVTSSNATLTVVTTTVAPTITTQPQGAAVFTGSTVNFTVAATGSPSPTYQWKKNGVNINGATAITYSINGAQLSSAGSYSVAVSNSAGSTTSNSAVLTVTTAPTPPNITAQPQSASVNQGAPVSFSATATGTAPLGYQWRKNGVAIPNALSAVYTIAAAQASDAASYSVAISNSAGTVTSMGGVLSVAVLVLPTFTLQPVTQSVEIGGSVAFSAGATGNPAPTYQWQRNGVDIPGATGANYSIASATNGDGGTYAVVATNSLGSVTSNVAVLTIGLRKNDFNADGKSDFLWQNSVTGERSIWLLDGTGVTSSASLGVVSLEWSMAATANFNGDGHIDLLWQNRLTGERNIWMMNGATPTAYVSLGVVSLDWWIAGTGDFNGDGKPDILWTNLTTGERTIWLMNGTTFIAGVSLGVVPLEWAIAGAADFSGGGEADILWQNTLTGEIKVWVMAGTVPVSEMSLGFQPLDWQVSGTGDFNADGKPGIMWTNVVTGERTIWIMNGTNVEGITSVATVGTEWVLNRPLPPRAPVDFNADMKTDLVWQNTATGERYVWFMNGTSYSGSALVDIVDPTWSIVGTGDFNNDGYPDLLWQDSATGMRRIFLMNGTVIIGSVDLGIVDPAWSIVAVADFNHDFHPDILWQNTTTGDTSIWYMNGTAIAGTANPGTAGPSWAIAGAGDFNSDGQPDIVWQNTVTGERWVWFMSGATFIGGASLGSNTLDWSIVAVADYNGDKLPDLVWENTVTGEHYIWLMSGTAFASGVSLGVLPLEWHIAH